MTADSPRLLDELALFADLGTAPPRVTGDGDRSVVRLFRGGEAIELTFCSTAGGRIVEHALDSGERRTHASYAALLASERFGDLRKWADAQKAFLESSLKSLDRNLVTGLLQESGARAGLQQADDVLASPERPDAQAVRVLLIDGPAGIGKTKFIEHLALSRAATFKSARRPLILHVQSRGRVLTFLQDLIAFSLQTLRLGVTYDQAPVLARHGLISIAIDGFDELGDPNGYDLAWGQINEFVNQVRGRGTLVLAGRETFIGRERLLRAVSSLSEGRDTVHALSLQPPSPAAAEKWLRRHGWSQKDLESTTELFEPGSYALRPFFLAQLADREVAATVRKSAAGSPLPFLVDLMIEREASKFGERVDNAMSRDVRETFVRAFLREVARNMADDQTEALDESVVSWLVEFATPDGMSAEVTSTLRNRAAAMAFLTTDDRPRYRRFAHSQLLNHFLGEETVDLIGRREMPRYVRRNILGADFLLGVRRPDRTPRRIGPGACSNLFRRGIGVGAELPVDRPGRTQPRRVVDYDAAGDPFRGEPSDRGSACRRNLVAGRRAVCHLVAGHHEPDRRPWRRSPGSAFRRYDDRDAHCGPFHTRTSFDAGSIRHSERGVRGGRRQGHHGRRSNRTVARQPRKATLDGYRRDRTRRSGSRGSSRSPRDQVARTRLQEPVVLDSGKTRGRRPRQPVRRRVRVDRTA